MMSIAKLCNLLQLKIYTTVYELRRRMLRGMKRSLQFFEMALKARSYFRASQLTMISHGYMDAPLLQMPHIGSGTSR
jgi:hypothetical protein